MVSWGNGTMSGTFCYFCVTATSLATWAGLASQFICTCQQKWLNMLPFMGANNFTFVPWPSNGGAVARGCLSLFIPCFLRHDLLLHNSWPGMHECRCGAGEQGPAAVWPLTDLVTVHYASLSRHKEGLGVYFRGVARLISLMHFYGLFLHFLLYSSIIHALSLCAFMLWCLRLFLAVPVTLRTVFRGGSAFSSWCHLLFLEERAAKTVNKIWYIAKLYQDYKKVTPTHIQTLT